MADQFDRWLESELRSGLGQAGLTPPPQVPRYLGHRAAPDRRLRWARPAGRLGAVAIVSVSLLLGGTAYAAVHLAGEIPFGPQPESPTAAAGSSCHPEAAGCHQNRTPASRPGSSRSGSSGRARPSPSAGPSASPAAGSSSPPANASGHHRAHPTPSHPAHPTPSHPAHPTHPPTPAHGKPSPSASGAGNGTRHSHR
jgi:hypothetical protein